eukprot:12659708-Alexandrium_andersonii.AAC.1
MGGMRPSATPTLTGSSITEPGPAISSEARAHSVDGVHGGWVAACAGQFWCVRRGRSRGGLLDPRSHHTPCVR